MSLRRILVLFGLALVATGIAWTFLHKEDPGIPQSRFDAADRARRLEGQDAVPTPHPPGNPAPAHDPAPGGARAFTPVVESAAARPPRRIAGRVHEPEGKPVAGAGVTVRLVRGDVVDDLGSAVAAADGSFSVDLTHLADIPEILRAPGRVEVDASAPGHRPLAGKEAAYIVGRRGADEWTSNPELEPGGTLRGRVIARGGRPIAGARVSTTTPDGTRGRETRSDATGRFALGIEDTGEHRVQAVAAGVGATVSGPVRLSKDADADAGDVVLDDLGTFEGVARFEDGTKASAVPVAAVAEGSPSEEFDEAEPAEAGGLLSNRTTTDAEGRFRLTGLVPGRYAVFAGPPAEGRPSTAYATGSKDVVLSVASRRLRVRVLDPDGRPVPGALYHATWRLDGGGEDQAMGTVSSADATFDVWGPPGRRFMLSAEVPGAPPGENFVVLDGARHETEASVAIHPSSGPMGSIRLSVLGPAGEPIRRFDAYCATAFSETRVPWPRGRGADADGRLPPLFPGRYRLTVYPERPTSGAPLELCFPIEAVVEVRSGVETPVTLHARRGGRLRLMVRGGGDRKIEEEGIHVEARSRSGGGPVHLPVFVREAEDGGWYVGGLVPRSPCVGLFLFEPGAYDLDVQVPGFKPVQEALAILEGRISDVNVVLDPE